MKTISLLSLTLTSCFVVHAFARDTDRLTLDGGTKSDQRRASNIKVLEPRTTRRAEATPAPLSNVRQSPEKKLRRAQLEKDQVATQEELKAAFRSKDLKSAMRVNDRLDAINAQLRQIK